MKTNPKKTAYNMRYAKENNRQIKFSFSNKYDADIIAHLDAQENKQGYIKALIREDMARAKSGEASAQNPEQAQPEAAARAKVSTAPAQNIMMEDATMEYKENSLSQSLPIDAQKDALPIRENSTRAKSENRGSTAMNKNIINFLNRHSEELFRGQKVTGYDRVFWANMTTLEVYAHSTDAEILGSINGYKVADITDDWKIVLEREKKMWYAVQINREDDWGTGSYDKEEAIRMAREQLAEYPDTLIAVIDNSTSNPVCVEEITDLDAYETPSDAPAQNPDATPINPGVPSGGNPWYAVIATHEDDWSKGSFNLDEAKAMARETRKKHPCAMIAVIDNSLDYPFCSDTIPDF